MNERLFEGGKSVYCNSCGKDAGDNKLCPHCGNAQVVHQTFRCSTCGNVIAPGTEACPLCGNRVFNTGQVNPVQGNALMVESIGVVGRAIPALIDLIILFVINFCLGMLFGGTAAVDDSGTLSTHLSVEGTPVLLLMFAPLAYWVLLEGIFGKTVGKMIAGLKVVMEDGSAITPMAAVIRNLVRIVDIVPFFYVVGTLSVLTSDRKQRLGDRAANTIVVKAK